MNTNLLSLTNLGTEAVQSAVESYTSYFTTAAVLWGLSFAILAFAASGLSRKMIEELDREHRDYDRDVVIAILVSILGLAFFFGCLVNVTTLLNPKAIAIHQLLQDATGR